MARNASHLSLFLPADLHKALERQAHASDRSVSAEARLAIRSHLSGVGLTSPLPAPELDRRSARSGATSATWGKSAEEAEEAQRIAEYSEARRRLVWGE